MFRIEATRNLKARVAKREQGFTLIEMLVTILIIGILAAIAIMIFMSQRDSAVEASLKSDMRNAATAYQGSYKNGVGYDVGVLADIPLSEGTVIRPAITGIKGEGTFCLSGYNMSRPEQIMYYDNTNGGLSNSATDCVPEGSEEANETVDDNQPVQCHPELARYFNAMLDATEYQLQNPEMGILNYISGTDSSVLTSEQREKYEYYTTEGNRIMGVMNEIGNGIGNHPDVDIIMAQFNVILSTKYTENDPKMKKLNDLTNEYMAELYSQSTLGTLDNPEKMEQIRQEAIAGLADYRSYICSAV